MSTAHEYVSIGGSTADLKYDLVNGFVVEDAPVPRAAPARLRPLAEKVSYNKLAEEDIDSANVNQTNENGDTLLYIACQMGCTASVQSLLERDADVNKVNSEGTSPLLVACFKNHIEVVRLLLDNGADINLANKIGQMPLRVACEKNHVDLVRELYMVYGAQWRLRIHYRPLLPVPAAKRTKMYVSKPTQSAFGADVPATKETQEEASKAAFDKLREQLIKNGITDQKILKFEGWHVTRIIPSRRYLFRDPDGRTFDSIRSVVDSFSMKDKTGSKPSRFTGVYWCPSKRTWRAAICMQSRKIPLGTFVIEEDAARAYDAARAMWQTRMCYVKTPLNFPDEAPSEKALAALPPLPSALEPKEINLCEEVSILEQKHRDEIARLNQENKKLSGEVSRLEQENKKLNEKVARLEHEKKNINDEFAEFYNKTTYYNDIIN